MKIICAGLGKTGTKSITAALTRLGYEVYDFFEHMDLLEDEWRKVVLSDGGNEMLEIMFKDVDVTISTYIAAYWEDILEVFPNAKVILTVRDCEEDFVKSIIHQFGQDKAGIGNNIASSLSPTFRAYLRFANAYMLHIYPMYNYNERQLGPYLKSEVLLTQAYRRHIAYVKQCCPKDQLLVFNCKDGWTPLCNFLGVPVPDESFPHKNIRGQFTGALVNSRIMRRVRREVNISALTLLLASGAASYFFIKSLLRR